MEVIMGRIVSVLAVLCCALPAFAREPWVIGHIERSPMTVTINGIQIPSYTINDGTCVFIGDLEECGFTLTRDSKVCCTTLRRNTGGASKIDAVKSAVSHTGAVIYPDWTLYLNYREVPAYEYNGQLLMYVKDLSIFGTLDIQPVKRQIMLLRKPSL
jgi:hypothetical protein